MSKMKKLQNTKHKGFSLIELVISMTIVLVLMGIATTLFAGALGTRTRESRKTDALTSARAALNIISRELGNSGYGLTTNGIVTADSNAQRIHFRANLSNGDYTTASVGENVTYFYDATTQSIVRYDPNTTPTTSVVVNRISNVTFLYFDYIGSNSTPTSSSRSPRNSRLYVLFSISSACSAKCSGKATSKL